MASHTICAFTQILGFFYSCVKVFGILMGYALNHRSLLVKYPFSQH
jgi:hypothetical protein